MQDEYDELGQQMSDMLQNTTYGGTNLFGVSGTSNTGTDGLFQSAVTFQVGAESSDTMTVNISSQLNTLVTDLSAISNSFSADQADTTGTAGVSGGTELTASGSANQMITSISTAMDGRFADPVQAGCVYQPSERHRQQPDQYAGQHRSRYR